MRLKILAVATAFGVALAAAWFFGVRHSKATSSDAAATSAGTPAGTRVAIQPAQRDGADARLRLLERRMLELESELASRPPSAAEPSPVPAQADPPLVPNPAEEAATNTRKIAALAEVLRSESRDPTWSRDTETKIQQTFDKGDFKGSSLGPVECRSTFCSFRARHDDQAARDLFERFGRSMPGMGAEFIYETTADGRLETAAYFIRPDRDGAEHPARQAY